MTNVRSTYPVEIQTRQGVYCNLKRCCVALGQLFENITICLSLLVSGGLFPCRVFYTSSLVIFSVFLSRYTLAALDCGQRASWLFNLIRSRSCCGFGVNDCRGMIWLNRVARFANHFVICTCTSCSLQNVSYVAKFPVTNPLIFNFAL